MKLANLLEQKILLGSGGFAPHGYWAIIMTMVIILVNFQGSEIIGLAAGECKDPAKSIPNLMVINGKTEKKNGRKDKNRKRDKKVWQLRGAGRDQPEL